MMPAPSGASTHGATDAPDFLDLRWLTRRSAVPPPPSQHLQGSPVQPKLPQSGGGGEGGGGCGQHLLWPQKTASQFHPAVPSFPSQSSHHPSILCATKFESVLLPRTHGKSLRRSHSPPCVATAPSVAPSPPHLPSPRQVLGSRPRNLVLLRLSSLWPLPPGTGAEKAAGPVTAQSPPRGRPESGTARKAGRVGRKGVLCGARRAGAPFCVPRARPCSRPRIAPQSRRRRLRDARCAVGTSQGECGGPARPARLLAA